MNQEDEIRAAASELLTREPKCHWVRFFREILGLSGVIRRTFRTPEELGEFYRTDAYGEILGILTRLRERPIVREDPKEPTRVITVRLPKSLHEALRVEAYERETSLNKLCISKLLAATDPELIPRGAWKRTQTERNQPG